ncbi:MAG TPA: radical SAM protein, partial [Candidatus Absconditabacterales bacterium]|nr:radical SAM protein [Candidatus Absconditabacterales bacterium]
MNTYQNLILKIIELNTKEKLTIDDLKMIKRNFAKQNKLADIPTNIKLLRAYHQLIQDKKIKKDIDIENLLKKRAIRSESGIVAVQVLTKPYACPGQCIFCPNEKGMPKSYISTEPGAMRAALNQFDPIKQTYNRLLSLTMTGHQTDKIEMIVLGGTRDVYPKDYKEEFVKKLYDACNTFYQLEIDLPDDTNTPFMKGGKGDSNLESTQPPLSPSQRGTKKNYGYTIKNLDQIKYSSSIQEAIKINETADNRIIGLTIETRPEYVTDENCKLWREMGVTRLEIGVQSMYDEVLEANKRGHSVQQIRDAIHKLRQYGFKFSVHIMPGLYKSNYKKDLGTFQQIYSDPFIKPDEIKFYPTSVIPNTKLYDLYVMGEYKPLATDGIKKLIKETFQDIIPPYTR